MTGDEVDRLRARVLRYLVESRPDGHCRLGLGRVCELLECSPAEALTVVERACEYLPATVDASATDKTLTLSITTDVRSDAVQEVFEHWIAATKRDPKRTKLTTDRRRKVNARLGEGYTVDDLKAAVDGNMLSDFHVENGYTDLVHALKSGANVDKFSADARERRSSSHDAFAARIRRAGR